MPFDKVDTERVPRIQKRIRKMTGGKAVSLVGALEIAFQRIDDLTNRLDRLGTQTLSDIPEGGEIDPHWRGKIEP